MIQFQTLQGTKTNFSIYKYYVDFQDGSGEKRRPIVIIKIDDDNFESTALGIYSHKDKFEKKKEFYSEFLYKIQDLKETGLDKRSYVDVSILEKYSLLELLMGAEYIGKLSEKDIKGLKDKFDSFHNK